MKRNKNPLHGFFSKLGRRREKPSYKMDGNSINTSEHFTLAERLHCEMIQGRSQEINLFYNSFGTIKKNLQIKKEKNEETATGFLNEGLLQILASSSRQ
jgi:hypothetical protein